MLLLLAMACANPQAGFGRDIEPALLTADELIDRLPPVGQEWTRTDGPWSLTPVAEEFRIRIERGDSLSDEQWKRALTRTGVLRWRSPWPGTEPFAVSMRAPGWLKLTRIELRPRSTPLETAHAGELAYFTCGLAAGHASESALYQELGDVSPGSSRLTFDLQLERGAERRSRSRPRGQESVADAEGAHPATGEFHRGALALEVELVPMLDEAIPPVSSTELNRAVADSMWLQFDSNSEERKAHVVVAPNFDRTPELAGVGLSLQVELLEAGVLRETVQLRPETFDPELDPETRRNDHAFYPLYTLPIAAEEDAVARAPWTLRVTGTALDVLRLWGARTRWSGRIVLPLDDLLSHAQERNPEHRPVWSLR